MRIAATNVVKATAVRLAKTSIERKSWRSELCSYPNTSPASRKMPGIAAASLEGTKAWGAVVVVVVRATA
jgi:hypothetical protein